MSYRPITDIWIPARPKVKYYGAYPAGFLERARALMGVHPSDAVLHVCGGMVKKYPYKPGYGVNDATLDLDPKLRPTFLRDARLPFPLRRGARWKGIMIDRPYSEPDADRYFPGRDKLPTLRKLLLNGLRAVRVGGCVGILDYKLPRIVTVNGRKKAKLVAVIAVWPGFEANMRAFGVYRRLF